MDAKTFFREKLARLEYHLKAFIEGTSVHFVISPTFSQQISTQLREILQENHQVLEDGRLLAPNYFLIAASPLYAEQLRHETHLLMGLEKELEHLALQAGLTFASPPVIQIIDDEEIPHQQILVSGYFSQDMTATQGVPEEKSSEIEMPHNAFLIVDGVRIFPLDRAVINIGRHPDNHLVLNDPRVSRQHAQLRAVRGKYILFDLGSVGGTTVNNLRVHQAILSSGDVIALAGVPLVYGEDNYLVDGTQKLTMTSH